MTHVVVASAERTIDAPAGQVYRYLADTQLHSEGQRQRHDEIEESQLPRREGSRESSGEHRGERQPIDEPDQQRVSDGGTE